MKKILKVENLEVSFHTYAGEVKAVRGISFDINEGESVAIVGESGSGKSVTAKSIMRLIHEPGEIKKTSKIELNGEDIMKYNYSKLRRIRGSQVSMIFQDALTSLNPTKKVGKQIAQSLIIHNGMSKHEAHLKSIEMLSKVKIPNPEKRVNQYPHEFSGGMRQRAMIAVALVNNPKLIIADEPTTALDVTVQAQILELLQEMQKELNMTVIMITHDLGIVAGMADKILVMYGGLIIEEGNRQDIFYSPKHPYTWALLQSVPRLNTNKKHELYSIKGTPPDLLCPPKGCPFAPRCEYRMNICNRLMPEKHQISETHSANCWLLHENAPKVDGFTRLEVSTNGEG